MQLNPKTNSYSNNEYAVAIAKIVVLTGISSAIESYEMNIIIEFLRKHFTPRPHPSKADVTIMSPEYLVKIWEYGCGGKFPMPENYTKLSPEYMSKVIQAFRAWRRQVNTRPPVYQLPEPVAALKPAENDALNKSIVLKAFDRYKLKGFLLFGAVCYDALVELKQFDNTLFEDYFDRANVLEKLDREQEGRNSGSMSTYRSLVNNIGKKTIETRAKTIAVEEYFKTIETSEDLGL